MLRLIGLVAQVVWEAGKYCQQNIFWVGGREVSQRLPSAAKSDLKAIPGNFWPSPCFVSHCALIFAQLGCDFGVLDAWKIVFLSRRNSYFWKMCVLSCSFVFHRKLDPKALHLDAKNVWNAMKNTNNVEIGWIGCTSCLGTWKTLPKNTFSNNRASRGHGEG